MNKRIMVKLSILTDFNLFFIILLFSKMKRNVKILKNKKYRINLENYILQNIIKQYKKMLWIYVLLMPQHMEREGVI